MSAVNAALRSAGQNVPAWVSTPEQPVLDRSLQQNTIALIARDILTAGATYEVEITCRVNGTPQRFAWSFTTAKSFTPQR